MAHIYADQMNCPEFEFHITREAREKYQFEETLFSMKGQIIFANFQASRLFADLLNKQRLPAETIHAGELNAMGLLDEIMHFLIEKYRLDINPSLFEKMEKRLIAHFGRLDYERLLIAFADLFPTTEVYRGDLSVPGYLMDSTGGLSNRYVVIEELLVLWLDNQNPAYAPIHEIIDESALLDRTVYDSMFKILNSFFQNEPFFGPDNLPLLELLQLPAKKFPHSIMAQLEFIKSRWGIYLAPFLSRILLGMDVIREEQKLRFDIGVFGPGPSEVLEFIGVYEPEQFSIDLDWMPHLVLIAKSTYVWLDQLSKQYRRPISRLDQVPDAELDRLARHGFTGLWLIGLWERSNASQKIKQMCGNPEAVASAYSLYDYEIAQDLGGEAALKQLKDRAWLRGIRLASDMVPNHMGIFSRWVIQHPHWFIQSPYPPYPKYSFNGPDLSDDPRVGLFIEDGYWNRTDAAVVFKRWDKWTGDVRYIYHGNDGTSYPWNDTAQLNYLLPEVREAVIQTILHVARNFPIIRFDAAMTLAKKHYQRLWFPEPGSGGDIPSRAEHGLTKPQFDEVFPNEFWREVVDRIQQEAPDTLLLAEAFWLMEGYFVRTLGMHRVYNSAFMNMLKNEENQKYRQSIKNVLEFNPQILKRYVNFMNNPDEDTAVAQFGKDDKYFGACMMMCTMPGLPMFGHGQIEGFAEKYGMEYRRAYHDEQPDEWLVRRHEREIFPLLRKRYLFSDVENFLLFDFFTGDGAVNENVFAYSNRSHNERSLVIYNNKYEQAAGWIRQSAAFITNNGLAQKSLSEGLHIPDNPYVFIIFHDMITGLDYIRSARELCERGLYVEVGAFKYHVFIDFREVWHTQERPYAGLAEQLKGQPARSIDDALDEFCYRPIITAFEDCVNPGSLRWLVQGMADGQPKSEVAQSFQEKLTALSEAVSEFEQVNKLDPALLEKIKLEYLSSLQIPSFWESPAYSGKKILAGVSANLKNYFTQPLTGPLHNWRILLTLPFLQALRDLYRPKDEIARDLKFLETRIYDKILKRNFLELGASEYEANREALLLKILLTFPEGLHLDKGDPVSAFLTGLIENVHARAFLKINRYNNVVYFNKEAFEELVNWLFIISIGNILFNSWENKKPATATINERFRLAKKLIQGAEKSGYMLEEFLKSI